MDEATGMTLLTTLKVLYVEDNPVDADLAQRTLARLAPDLDIDIAATVLAANARLSGASTYDVALIDLRLPDGSGLDVLAHIREHGLPMAVVMLTGSSYQEPAIIALKAGADDYLVKRGDYLERLPQTLRIARSRYLSETARKSRPLRVLYAEHNQFDIDLTQRYLTQYFPYIHLVTVHEAADVLACLPFSGDAALDYDVVLLDYHLHGLNALEVAKILLQERHLDLPIVLVTSEGNEEVVAQALRLGVSDYLIKHQSYLYELPAILEKVYHQTTMVRERRALQEAKRQYEELVARIPVGVYRYRLFAAGGMGFDYVSPRFCTLLGQEEAELLHDSSVLCPFVHADDREDLQHVLRQQFENPDRFHWEGRFQVHDELRWLRFESVPTRLANGDTVWDGVLSDITACRRAEERLRLAGAVLDSTRDGVLITDLQGNILMVNRACSMITGYSEAELRGQNPRLLQSGRHDCAFYQSMWASIQQIGYWQGELWNRRRNGELYPQRLSISTVCDERGTPTHYVGTFTDISQLKRTEEQLTQLVHYDPLTGLPNRLLGQSRLTHAVERAHRDRQRVGVLFIDLDRFKNVNDSLGHPVGDELLRAIAQRMRQRLRDEDTLARLGGDEFLVVLENLHRPEDAASTAQILFTLLAESFTLPAGQEVYINASIGISLYPEDGGSATELLQHADAAVHQAKEQGRNTYRFYTAALTRVAHERLDLEGRLRRALERNEFQLYYQPLLSVEEGRVFGVEALLRWQPAGEEGLMPPARFIPLAEETGLIVPIGEWVLRTACAQAQAWRQAGWPLLLAVNLSVRQFQRQDISEQVCAVLADSGLPPDCLELEITESTLLERGSQAETTLAALKNLGVKLAIDDFGTGYSSLAYLKRFPIDKLKIDQSFVHDIPHDSGDMEIAAAIIALARNLRLEVLAEGVETPEQLTFLRAHGCDSYQGYLFSPPVPAERLGALLKMPVP